MENDSEGSIPPIAPVPLGSMGPSWSFGAAVDATTRALKSRWTTLLVIGLMFGGIASVPSVIGMLTKQQGGAGFQCFAFVYGMLVTAPMAAGMMCAGARVVRGSGEPADAMAGFRRYPAVLGTAVIVNLINIGALLPALGCGAVALAFIGDGAMGGLVGWLLLLVAVVLAALATGFVSTRIGFALAICADPEMGAVGPAEAISMAFRRTRSCKWSLLGFVSLLGFAAGLTVLLLCIGFFVVGLPLMVAGLGAAYQLAIVQGRDA